MQTKALIPVCCQSRVQTVGHVKQSETLVLQAYKTDYVEGERTTHNNL